MAKRDVGHIDTATVLMNIEAEITSARRDRKLADRAEAFIIAATETFADMRQHDETGVEAADFALWSVRFERLRRDARMRRNVVRLATMAMNNDE